MERDMEENDEERRDLSEKYSREVDVLVKSHVDNKRIKKIDQTKKKAAVESVVDEKTAFLLNKLLIKGVIERIEGIISAGKEANVYLAYDQDQKEIAIKVYKIDNNTSRWMRNYIIGDPRFKKIPRNVSKIISLWASKEFKNLKRAHKAGIRVPDPIYCKDNVLIMEYIGFGPIPAPKLKDIKKIINLEEIFEEILNYMDLLFKKAKLVHGDLSEFNILYHNQQSVIIDISQAVSIDHPKAEQYLVRDIKNIFTFFGKSGLELPDPKELYYSIINLN